MHFQIKNFEEFNTHLENKVTLIIGDSSGTGKSTAIVLSKKAMIQKYFYKIKINHIY